MHLCPILLKREFRVCQSSTNVVQYLIYISIAITQGAVQLKMVELESCQLCEGNDTSLHPDISPSMFITTGIDLESEQ
jgi:hypothetical protein